MICQKISAVSEKFSASIFGAFAVQENYSEWTLTTRAQSSLKKSLTSNQSLLRYMPEYIIFRSQCFFAGNSKQLNEYTSFRKSAFVADSSILGCCAVSIDIYRISKALRSLETSVILSAHTALSPINQHSSRINFVHLLLYLSSEASPFRSIGAILFNIVQKCT